MKDQSPHTPYLNGTRRISLRAVSGDSYIVDIAEPEGARPTAGWPAIYLLDAGGCFATAVEAMRRMSRRPDATGVHPALIVGISSSGEIYDTARRERDFTTLSFDSTGASKAGAGGAAAFLAFIESDLKPAIAADVAIDPQRASLFGHSLAGYFALWVLASHTNAFHAYGAISPSIWWDKDGLFQSLSQANLRDRKLLIAVGEWEEALPPWHDASLGAAHANVADQRKKRGMVSSARQLAQDLRSAMNDGALDYVELAGEDHASIVSAAIPRMLRIASRK